MSGGSTEAHEATVLVDVVGAVATITLNRPHRHNAIDDATSTSLADAVHRAIADGAVRVIVLRGAGPSFCSGRDVAQLGARPPGMTDYDFIRRAQDTRLAMLDSPKPVIASVHGHAIGGGLELALSADVRIAAPDATFSLPEVRHGLVPDTGGTQLLTALVGPGRAKLMVMSGEPIGAAEALAWGLVDRLVERSQLDSAAYELAQRFAEASPLVLAAAKQLVDLSWGERVRSGIRQELLAQVALFSERRSAR